MNVSKLGDYQIVRKIGQGGMGAVYEAVHPSIGRRVAIKVLLPDFAHHDEVVRRFFNEAKAVNAINHPGVVQVSGVGTAEDGSLYLIMEYLDGPTLSERIEQRRGRLDESEAITITWQLAGVLSAAHGKNIIHRDLKPGNIMLVPDQAGPGGERVKLLDFGIAKLGVEHQTDEKVKTRTGQMLGTAAFMSPEQFMGRQIIDAKTDVYSLGVVLYRLLAGRVPFISTNGEMALGMMHLTEEPPPLAEFAADTSEWLQKLVHRMLQKAPAQRPSMAEVMAELQEHMPLRAAPATGQNPIASPPTAVAPRPSRTSEADTITRASGQQVDTRLSRRPAAFLAIGGALLVFGGATGIYFFTQGSPRHPTPAARPQPAPSKTEPSSEIVDKPSPAPRATPRKSEGSATAATSSDKTEPARDKGVRSPASPKPPERKSDDKPRRAAKSAPTPIID